MSGEGGEASGGGGLGGGEEEAGSPPGLGCGPSYTPPGLNAGVDGALGRGEEESDGVQQQGGTETEEGAGGGGGGGGGGEVQREGGGAREVETGGEGGQGEGREGTAGRGGGEEEDEGKGEGEGEGEGAGAGAGAGTGTGTGTLAEEASEPVEGREGEEGGGGIGTREGAAAVEGGEGGGGGGGGEEEGEGVGGDGEMVDASTLAINTDIDDAIPTQSGQGVSSRQQHDLELYKLLAPAALCGELEPLLGVAHSRLPELSSVNSAFALIHIAKMIQGAAKRGRRTTSSSKRERDVRLQSLISHVEGLVLEEDERRHGKAARASSAISVGDPSQVDTGTDQQGPTNFEVVEDKEDEGREQGLHLAWTISSTCWGLGILQHETAPSIGALARLAVPVLPVFRPVQLVNALWSFAALTLPHPQSFLRAVASTVEARMEDFNKKSLSIILWTFASAQVCYDPLLDAIPQALTGHGSVKLRPQELANVAWSYASLLKPHAELFEALGNTACARLAEFRPQQVSLVAWSFAMVNSLHEGIFQAIEKDVIARVETAYPPQCLANILRAYVVVAQRGEPLFQSTSQAIIIKRISEFKPQAMANVCWAFAGRKHVGPEFFDTVAKESLNHLKSFSLSALTGMLLNFSKVQLPNEALFRAAAQEAGPRLKQFAAESFVRLVRSFAVAGAVEQRFAGELAQEALARASTLSPAELVHLTKSFVRIGRVPPELLETMAQCAKEGLKDLCPKELTSIVCSLSDLGLSPGSPCGKAVYQKAAERATQRLLNKGSTTSAASASKASQKPANKAEKRRAFQPSDLAGLARALAPAANSLDRRGAPEGSGELVAAIDKFFEVLVHEAQERLSELAAAPGTLVAVLCSCAQRSCLREPLLSAAEAAFSPSGGAAAVERLRLTELQELTEAFTAAGLVPAKLFRAIAAAAISLLKYEPTASSSRGSKSSCSSSGTLHLDDITALPGLLWQFSTSGIAVPGLCATAVARALRQMELPSTSSRGALPAWVIAQCIGALSISDTAAPTKSAVGLLAQAAKDRLVELRPEERAVIVWGLSVQGCYDVPGIFDTVLAQTPWLSWNSSSQDDASSGTVGASGTKSTALAQVYMADLAFRLEAGREGLNEKTRRECHAVAVQIHRRRNSQIEKGDLTDGAGGADRQYEKQALISRVAQALATLGQNASLNRLTPEGLVVDVRIDVPGNSRICLEVDCPSAYVRDLSGGRARRFGPSIFRQRLLQRLGWLVVNVPWYDITSRTNEQLAVHLQAKLMQTMQGLVEEQLQFSSTAQGSAPSAPDHDAFRLPPGLQVPHESSGMSMPMQYEMPSPPRLQPPLPPWAQIEMSHVPPAGCPPGLVPQSRSMLDPKMAMGSANNEPGFGWPPPHEKDYAPGLLDESVYLQAYMQNAASSGEHMQGRPPLPANLVFKM